MIYQAAPNYFTDIFIGICFKFTEYFGKHHFFSILCFIQYVVPSVYSSSSVKIYVFFDWVYMFTVEFISKYFGETTSLIGACSPRTRFWPHSWEGRTLGCPCLALHSSHPQTERRRHSQRSLAKVWPEFLHQVSHSLAGVRGKVGKWAKRILLPTNSFLS